jgi:long-subunit fatty acid transport protein
LSYDFTGGVGLERTQIDATPTVTVQTDTGSTVTLRRASIHNVMTVSPSLSVKVNRCLSLSLGYTHYNTAAAIGALRGNAVHLSTDLTDCRWLRW